MEVFRPTADLCDEFENKCAVCTEQFMQYGARRSFAGRIRTIECWEDNGLVRRLLETKSDGGVLVVDGGGSLAFALLGDNLAKLGADNGWSGVVIRGAVRDSRALGKIDFGIKALGAVPRRSAKRSEGVVDGVITFGNVRFTPGCWLASDDDGIVVAAGKLY